MAMSVEALAQPGAIQPPNLGAAALVCHPLANAEILTAFISGRLVWAF